MKMPVRFVDIDDISAFAAWRSQRDGVTYRLPTEAEWEFAARNGPKQNLYPWGDTYDPKCAVLDKDGTEPEAVGTHSCPNDWGVVDLIGNVFEWTGTKAAVYPGSKVQIKESKEPHFMIRGGAALYKSSGQFAITSAFRADVEASKRDKELGFRLVTQ
jgi:formylglycine-generating enzyme required for sulfatase activity